MFETLTERSVIKMNYEKYGANSAKLWNVSNISFKISLCNLLIGLFLIFLFIFMMNEVLFEIGVTFLVCAQVFFWVGQISIVIYQILRKDYIWMVGSLIFFLFIFMYMDKKKNELSINTSHTL